jgi:hypothetical protein
MLPTVMPKPFVNNKDGSSYAYVHARLQNQRLWRRNTMRAILVTCAVIGVVNVGKAFLMSSSSSRGNSNTTEFLHKTHQPASTPSKPPSLRGRDLLAASSKIGSSIGDDSMDELLNDIVNKIVARRAKAVVVSYPNERERQGQRKRPHRRNAVQTNLTEGVLHLVDIKIAPAATRNVTV